MTNKEVGIYLIDKRKFKNKSNDNIISEIIGNTKRKYNMLEIENNKIDNYNIKLYNYISYSQDLWSTFFNCKTNDKKLIKKDSISNNFIAFIYKEDNIFCITTNKAYNDIQKYIVYFYGVYIMSYFIKSEDKIRSATYSNIMSNFLGGSEYLGEEYQTTLNKYWDRINTNLMTEVDKKRLYTELNLKNKRKNSKVRCDAKDNFTICSKINIEELIKIIKKLDEISNDTLIDKFNNIERVKDEEIIKKLEENLLEHIYSKLIDKTLDVCIVHKNIDTFFNSMSYTFYNEGKNVYECDTIPTSQDILKVFEILEVNSKEKLLEILKKVNIMCWDSDSVVILSDSLKNYLNINIEIEGTNYIYQNKVWYKLTDNYINNLNEIFEMIKLNYSENDINFEKWNDETETEYINKYKYKDNFYKIHPRLEDEIEVCDLMYIDRKNKIVKLLYLKNGFGASTRDLAIQTTMGLKRLNSLMNSEERLKRFYNKYIITKNSKYKYSDFKSNIKSYCKNAIIVYKLNGTEKSNIGKQSIIFAKNEIELMGKSKFSMKQL
jgi:uncharacterized protein (TIGR04141 family)